LTGLERSVEGQKLEKNLNGLGLLVRANVLNDNTAAPFYVFLQLVAEKKTTKMEQL
jgi:hypothetical protein